MYIGGYCRFQILAGYLMIGLWRNVLLLVSIAVHLFSRILFAIFIRKTGFDSLTMLVMRREILFDDFSSRDSFTLEDEYCDFI